MVSKLTTVEARQAYIDDKQIDAPPRLQELKARRTVSCLERLVAELAQHFNDEAPHHRLVLYHEHRLPGFRLGQLHHTRLGFAGIYLPAMPREVELQCRALPLF